MSKEPARKLVPNPEMTESDLDFIIKIARERAAKLRRMREAYLEGNIPAVLEIVRDVCDIPAETHQ